MKAVSLAQRVNDLKLEAIGLSNYIGHSNDFIKLNPIEQERLKVQNDALWFYIDSLQSRLDAYQDGTSCGHIGCLNHFTHPCENCGRIGGISHEFSPETNRDA